MHVKQVDVWLIVLIYYSLMISRKIIAIPIGLVIIGGSILLKTGLGGHTYNFSQDAQTSSKPSSTITPTASSSSSAAQYQTQATQDYAQSQQDLQDAQKIGQQSANNAAQAQALANQTFTTPTYTPAPTPATPDCSAYDTQMSALNTQMNQILNSAPTFSDPLAGGSTNVYATWAANVAPEEASINSQISALKVKYPSCP